MRYYLAHTRYSTSVKVFESKSELIRYAEERTEYWQARADRANANPLKVLLSDSEYSLYSQRDVNNNKTPRNVLHLINKELESN